MPPERDAPEVASLVRRAAGDHDAFADLVRAHQDGVHRVCLRIVRSPDLAADAAQETFLKLHAHLASYDAERSFRPWLYRIAVNTALSMQRSASRQTAALAGFARSLRSRGAAPLTEEQERLVALVDALPEKERALLHLRVVEGFGVGEIAAVFDMTPNAVSVALYKAKQRVITAAAEEGPDAL